MSVGALQLETLSGYRLDLVVTSLRCPVIINDAVRFVNAFDRELERSWPRPQLFQCVLGIHRVISLDIVAAIAKTWMFYNGQNNLYSMLNVLYTSGL